MKTYKQFEEEMTPEQKEKVKADIDAVFVPGALPCYSDKSTDVDKFALIKDVIWESECPPEALAEFEKELEE